MTKQDLVSDIADIEKFLDMAKECLIKKDNKSADYLLRQVVRKTKKVIVNIPTLENYGGQNAKSI